MSARNKSDGQNGKAAPTSLEVRFAQSQLSRSRRQLIRAILDNHEEAFFLSSREMARRYNVDAATIVRTAQAWLRTLCGFRGRPPQHFVTQITPYTVLIAKVKVIHSHGNTSTSHPFTPLPSHLNMSQSPGLRCC